jgi:predicted dehydrogenase/8-oxo-dGTP pyrophosphatase MutT (NUDIX family)
VKLIALLSWFREDVDQLRETVASLQKLGVDHLVAIDGAYALYPGATATSAVEQATAIMEAAEEAGIACTVHHPTGPFEHNEVGKRRLLFRLGQAHSEPGDWFFVVDADEVVLDGPEDLKQRLEDSEHDAAYAALLSEPAAAIEAQWAEEMPTVLRGRKVWPLRCFFRALPGLTVGRSHSDYVLPDGRNLWGQNESPALTLSDVIIDHRRHERPLERQAEAEAYYAIRSRMGVERSPKRVLIIGYGRMGKMHKAALERHHPDVDVLTVDPEWEADFSSLNGAPDAYMACIAVPPQDLTTVAREALERRMHVLVEKPVAMSAAEAEALMDFAEDLKLTVHTGYVERYNPVLLALKRHLPKLGQLRTFDSQRRGPAPGRPTAGPLLDLATHDLDVLDRFLNIRSPTVMACVGDERTCSLALTCGQAGGRVDCSYDHPEKIRTLSLTGSEGRVELDYQAQSLTFNGEQLPVERAEPLGELWHYALRSKGTRDESALRVLRTIERIASPVSVAA